MEVKLEIKNLTKENFKDFGDVIEFNPNNERVSETEVVENKKCAIKVISPKSIGGKVKVPFFESHPLSRQAFIPMNSGRFVIIVAKNNSENLPDIDTLEAFITNGVQGVNYNVAVWHCPFSSVEEDKFFTVIDRFIFDGEKNDVNLILNYPEVDILVENIE